MDYVPALNKARLAFLDTIEPVCTEVDALDMALRHYDEVLQECGYVIVPKEATPAMRDAAMGPAHSIFPTPYDRDHVWQVWRAMIAARPTDTDKASED